MYQRLVKLLTISVFVTMLFFPKQVFSGASRGLLLWFHSVLPTLLPFIILSNFLIQTEAVNWIVRVTGPLLRHIFKVSDYGSFAIVVGFLCGYPMGSKVTSDLLLENRISYREAQYLLSFCNNASPIFIISYAVLQSLQHEEFLFPALGILMGSPVLSSFLFRHQPVHVPQNPSSGSGPHRNPASQNITSGSLIDSCIMNGFETITKVGGYMMLFSILFSLAEIPGISGVIFQCLFLPSLEVTGGVALICSSTLSTSTAFFFCMICISFGGWCAVAQTRCMIAGTGLSIKSYIIQKLITALVTSLLCYSYLQFLY